MEYKFNTHEFISSQESILINPSGEIEIIDRHKYHCPELYKMLQCELVEVVYLPQDRIMIVDESGALPQTRKLNFIASAIASKVLGGEVYLFGKVLMCNNELFR